jgi:hypothetical protein
MNLLNTTPPLIHHNTLTNTKTSGYQSDAWKVIRVDWKNKGTVFRQVERWSSWPLLIHRFCQYWVDHISTGTRQMIMYNQRAKRSPGMILAIKEYWTERKRLGKMPAPQQMALDDGFY